MYKAVNKSSSSARLRLVDFSKAFDYIGLPTFLGRLRSTVFPQRELSGTEISYDLKWEMSPLVEDGKRWGPTRGH